MCRDCKMPAVLVHTCSVVSTTVLYRNAVNLLYTPENKAECLAVITFKANHGVR